MPDVPAPSRLNTVRLRRDHIRNQIRGPIPMSRAGFVHRVISATGFPRISGRYRQPAEAHKRRTCILIYQWEFWGIRTLQPGLFPTEEEQRKTVARSKAEVSTPAFLYAEITDRVVARISVKGES